MIVERYEPIDDWAPQARACLVSERQAEIEMLLDESIARYVDAGGSLADYGFHADDPVAEMTQWCLARFRDPEVSFDPTRLSAPSRSMRIFTEVDYWLSQRSTIEGHRARRRARPIGTRSHAHEAPSNDSEALDVTSFAARLRDGARALRDRTCAALVGWWLRGSRRLRRELLGHDADEGWGKAPAEDLDSAKEMSFMVADSLFRYYALWIGAVDRDGDDAHRACVETWFRPCPNRRRYEVPLDAVRDRLGGHPPRYVSNLRHAGVAALIRACAARARTDADGEILDRLLAGTSLRKSLKERFKVDDTETRAAIDAMAGREP